VIFGSPVRGFYREEVLQFLLPVAGQIALAMGDAVHCAELQNTRARLDNETTKLKLLLELNNAIVSDLDLQTLVSRVSPQMRSLMQVDAVALILPDPKSDRLHLHALDFPQRSAESHLPESLPRKSIAGEVFASGKPWTGSGGPLRSTFAGDFQAHTGLQTVCALPLIRRRRVLGVLGLGRLHEAPFVPTDVEFLMQVAQQVAIAVDNALEYRHATRVKDQLIHEKLYLEREIREQMQFTEIVGKSSVLRQILKHVETVAPTECTVLICGETGTGKELIARAIHELSAHKEGAFVKINCAALPAGLLESELFGHEKGAFTGATVQRIGRFELANHGTIFLDEISELPLELQPKLLRVLQEREFERLGSSRTIRTTARLVAGTNRNLKSMVSEQKFRADLFYRLNVFPLELPALRDRPEDIPVLANHFVRCLSMRLNKHIESISSETLEAFLRYSWPGNIREMQNIIERAVILSQGTVLKIPLSEFGVEASHEIENRGETLEEVERRHILSVLNDTAWVFSGPRGAAARLGIKRSTLQFRMKKLGISRPH
jgi:formate hydrogenlyase transcriptional activator